jgi:hypothetical protein
VAIAAKLPSTDRRDKLEEAAWAALQDAVEWMKTEEAASNVRARAVVVTSLIEKEEKSGVSHSDLHANFDRAIKRFMLTYQMPVGVAGLPAKHTPYRGYLALVIQMHTQTPIQLTILPMSSRLHETTSLSST